MQLTMHPQLLQNSNVWVYLGDNEEYLIFLLIVVYLYEIKMEVQAGFHD